MAQSNEAELKSLFIWEGIQEWVAFNLRKKFAVV